MEKEFIIYVEFSCKILDRKHRESTSSGLLQAIRSILAVLSPWWIIKSIVTRKQASSDGEKIYEVLESNHVAHRLNEMSKKQ